MISALEALDLPSAKLTAEEKTAADKLEHQIETWVLKNMKRNGVNFRTNVTDSPVIAEVNRRLHAAGWTTQWQPAVEEHPLNKAVAVHVGFALAMYPSDEVQVQHLKKTSALDGN